MVQQIKKQPLAGGRRSFSSALIAAAMLLVPSALVAESVASKNKDGNRLFAQGRYEDAEKAYLEAQVKNPGRPEVLYNLGNSLIKQKKYSQGIQSLRQSIEKGDRGMQKNGWYNTGNALFSMGDFKDSADAFIQALKLDPADRDSKHNLELALMKLKQQKQSGSGREDQNQDKSNKEQASSGAGSRRQQQKQHDQASSGSRNEPGRRQQTQAPQEARREGRISKEQANQILDALKNQELEQQRKLLESRARRKTNEKDW